MFKATIPKMRTPAPDPSLQIIHFNYVEECSLILRVKTARQNYISILEKGQSRVASLELRQWKGLLLQTGVSQIRVLSPVDIHAIPECVEALVEHNRDALGEIKASRALED